jgi:cysteine desulfuration protein SufE
MDSANRESRINLNLEEKKRDLIGDLSLLPGAQDRLMYLIDAAKKTPNLPPELRTDSYRVEGCLSNLWFVPEFRDGLCFFKVDADSHIVRGIAILLANYYSGEPPAEILRHDPGFLTEVGITQHLSPNRRNGLSRLWDKIRDFAAEHAAQN